MFDIGGLLVDVLGLVQCEMDYFGGNGVVGDFVDQDEFVQIVVFCIGCEGDFVVCCDVCYIDCVQIQCFCCQMFVGVDVYFVFWGVYCG